MEKEQILIDGQYFRVCNLHKIVEKAPEQLETSFLPISEGVVVEEKLEGFEYPAYVPIVKIKWVVDKPVYEDVAFRTLDVLDDFDNARKIAEFANCVAFAKNVLIDLFEDKE